MNLSYRIKQILFFLNEIITIIGCFLEPILFPHSQRTTYEVICNLGNSLIINLFHISLVSLIYIRGGGIDYGLSSFGNNIKKPFYAVVILINFIYLCFNWVSYTLSVQQLNNSLTVNVLLWIPLFLVLFLVMNNHLNLTRVFIFITYILFLVPFIEALFYSPITVMKELLTNSISKYAFILPFIFFEIYFTPAELKLYSLDIFPSLRTIIFLGVIILTNIILINILKIDTTQGINLIFFLPLTRLLRSSYVLTKLVGEVQITGLKETISVFVGIAFILTYYYRTEIKEIVLDNIVLFYKINNFMMTPFCLYLIFLPRDLFIFNEHFLLRTYSQLFCFLVPFWILSIINFLKPIVLVITVILLILAPFYNYDGKERKKLFFKNNEKSTALSLSYRILELPKFESLGDALIVQKPELSLTEIEALLVKTREARNIFYREKIDSSSIYRVPKIIQIYGTDQIVNMNIGGLKVSYDITKTFMNPRTFNEKKELFNLIVEREARTFLDTTAGVGVLIGMILSKKLKITCIYNDINPHSYKSFLSLIKNNGLSQPTTYNKDYLQLKVKNQDFVVYDNPTVVPNLDFLFNLLSENGTLVIYQELLEITSKDLEKPSHLILEERKMVKEKSKTIKIYRFIYRKIT